MIVRRLRSATIIAMRDPILSLLLKPGSMSLKKGRYSSSSAPHARANVSGSLM